MIRVIANMPPGTLGFEADGRVTDDDYRDVLVPVVKEALERGDVRLLYVLPDDTSYSPGAMWADTRLWAGNLRGWNRVAIVSDAEWLRNAVRAFDWMMPGKVRVFDDDDVEEAKAWLVADDDD